MVLKIGFLFKNPQKSKTILSLKKAYFKLFDNKNHAFI
jgi:hypothetical protein